MSEGTERKYVLHQVQSIFQSIFLDDSLEINIDSSPEDIEEWDSLAHVNVLAAVEKEFGFRFTAEQMGSISNVAEIIAAIPED